QQENLVDPVWRRLKREDQLPQRLGEGWRRHYYLQEFPERLQRLVAQFSHYPRCCLAHLFVLVVNELLECCGGRDGIRGGRQDPGAEVCGSGADGCLVRRAGGGKEVPQAEL